METARDSNIKIKILYAAKKLFAIHGFEGTTVRQICEEAGANVALISYHFGGKEKVFGALFEYFFPNDRLAAVDVHLHPLLGVKLIIQEVTKFREEDPELIRIIQQEIVMNSPRIQKIGHHVMPMWKLLRQWLSEGREQKLFHFRSLDTTLMSIIGTLLFYRNNAYWNVLVEEEAASIETMIEDLTDFVLGALHYEAK